MYHHNNNHKNVIDHCTKRADVVCGDEGSDITVWDPLQWEKIVILEGKNQNDKLNLHCNKSNVGSTHVIVV